MSKSHGFLSHKVCCLHMEDNSAPFTAGDIDVDRLDALHRDCPGQIASGASGGARQSSTPPTDYRIRRKNRYADWLAKQRASYITPKARAAL